MSSIQGAKYTRPCNDNQTVLDKISSSYHISQTLKDKKNPVINGMESPDYNVIILSLVFPFGVSLK